MARGESHPSSKELIEALEVARDRVRVQLHLLSLEARQRWEELEKRLLATQSKLEQEGQTTAAGAATKALDLARAAMEFLQDVDGSLELTTPVRNVMRSAPASCSPDDSLNRAAQIMWELDCGAVPIVNAEGNVVGIVTDRDLCMATYTRGQRLSEMTVGSTMSTGAHSCSPADSIGHAVRLMANQQVRRLPVIEDGRLAGMLSLADVARHIQASRGNHWPACAALAHMLAAISAEREATPARAAAE